MSDDLCKCPEACLRKNRRASKRNSARPAISPASGVAWREPSGTSFLYRQADACRSPILTIMTASGILRESVALCQNQCLGSTIRSRQIQGSGNLARIGPHSREFASGTSSNACSTSAGTRHGCRVANFTKAQFVEAVASCFPSAMRSSS